MNETISKLLKLRGIHFFATRFGSKPLRKLAFEEKFRSGEWNFASDNPRELMDHVKRHANNGNILIMGCGGASILRDLAPDSYASVLGIDLSSEAIRLASHYASPKVAFQQADMTEFQCSKPYDLIIFSESINYIPFFQRKRYLQKMCQGLKPGGSILITISQAKRYRHIFRMITKNFEVLADRQFTGSTRRLILFQPRTTGRSGAQEKPATSSATQPRV